MILDSLTYTTRHDIDDNVDKLHELTKGEVFEKLSLYQFNHLVGHVVYVQAKHLQDDGMRAGA